MANKLILATSFGFKLNSNLKCSRDRGAGGGGHVFPNIFKILKS